MIDTGRAVARLLRFGAVLAVAMLAACAGLDRDPTARMSAEQLYAEAKDELDSGNFVRARELLGKLEARYPFGRYAQQAQILTAYAFYRENDSAQAISACDRFLKLNPGHAHADYVHYLKGLATFSDDLGLFGRFFGQDPSERDPKAMREAFDAFRELVARYPGSSYAGDAKTRMTYLINAMAASEVHIARFYLQRRAYVAAIQRAQGAMRDYPTAPTSEEALSILMRAYDALGMTRLRDDARRVLERNFPGSRFLPAASAS
jgi:outer membrane protein assembly factor BamD